MTSDIKFVLDRSGGSNILRNNEKLQSIENGVMTGVLANIEAQFFQTFGIEGHFKLVEFTTDRSSVKISAADSRTSAILKKSPKWLDTFINNITI